MCNTDLNKEHLNATLLCTIFRNALNTYASGQVPFSVMPR